MFFDLFGMLQVALWGQFLASRFTGKCVSILIFSVQVFGQRARYRSSIEQGVAHNQPQASSDYSGPRVWISSSAALLPVRYDLKFLSLLDKKVNTSGTSYSFYVVSRSLQCWIGDLFRELDEMRLRERGRIFRDSFLAKVWLSTFSRVCAAYTSGLWRFTMAAVFNSMWLCSCRSCWEVLLSPHLRSMVGYTHQLSIPS